MERIRHPPADLDPSDCRTGWQHEPACRLAVFLFFHFFVFSRKNTLVNTFSATHQQTQPPSVWDTQTVTALPNHIVCFRSVTVGPPRKPSSDHARARAAAHAKIEPHRARHANSALKRNTRGSVLVSAFAMRRKNMAVSVDHLPPTSPARTTNRALDRGPTFWVGLLLASTSCVEGHAVPC